MEKLFKNVYQVVENPNEEQAGIEIIDGEFKTFPKYGGQRNVLLYSDFIATIVDPDPDLLEKYKLTVPPQDDEEEVPETSEFL